MSRQSIQSVLVFLAALTATSASLAQDARQAIASSDVLSQISMFNYRQGPKSDLFLRGTPIAANAGGRVQVEYEDGNAQISAKVENLPAPSSRAVGAHSGWPRGQPGRAGNGR